VTLYLGAFNDLWLIGLACFGIHLALLGYLILESGTSRGHSGSCCSSRERPT
jgi:hypothetical protein